MATEAAVPVLARDQLAVRHVERLALEVEILVASRARGGGHGDTHARVLAVARRTILGAERGARLGEPRLKKAMHGMGVLLARVAVGALRVGDPVVAERGVGRA